MDGSKFPNRDTRLATGRARRRPLKFQESARFQSVGSAVREHSPNLNVGGRSYRSQQFDHMFYRSNIWAI